MSLFNIIFDVAVAEAVIRTTKKLGGEEKKESTEKEKDENRYAALGVR